MNNSGSKQLIEQRMEAVRTKIRRVQLVRGLLIVASALLGGLLVIMAVDLMLAPTPQAVRWVLFGLWVVVIGVAVKMGFQPMVSKIGLVQIARWIELRHPDLQERMSSALELSSGSGASEELVAALIAEAGEDVTKVNPELEVNAARTSRSWLRPVIALAVVLLIGLIIFPKQAMRLITRAVAPFSDVGNAGAARFKVQPGNVELLEGDALEIKIGYQGKARTVELEMELETGETLKQPTSVQDGNHVYRQEPVRKTFRYRARAGRDESDFWTVKVWPLPRLLTPRLTLTYPAYTGWLPDEGLVGRRAEAVAGTKLRLQGNPDTPVESAWLMLAGKRRIEANINSPGSPVMFETPLTVADSGEAVVWLHHRLGRDVAALRFELQVMPDKAPSVVWLKPARKELRVRPDDTLDLRYEATEDIGLAKVALELGKDGKVVLPQNLPQRVMGSNPPRFRGALPMPVWMLREKLAGARDFQLRVRAEDARTADLDGPGRGFTDWLSVKIDENAISLVRQDLLTQQKDALETLNEAIQTTKEARDRMERNRKNLIQADRSDDALKLETETRERLETVTELLGGLSQQMEAGVLATKAPLVKAAAGLVKQSHEDFDQVPLQANENVRSAKLNEAKQESEEAIRKLEAARAAVQAETPKLNALARLMELSQQQNELARQAAAMKPEAPITAPWTQQQNQVKEAIQQEILAAQLAAMPAAPPPELTPAQQAQELAERARKLANDQNKLQKQAAEVAQQTPAPAEQAMPAAKAREAAAAKAQAAREALAQEQAAIAKEVSEELAQARQEKSEMKGVLPDTAEKTQKAAEALAENQSPANAAKHAERALDQALRHAMKQEAKPKATPEAAAKARAAREDLAKLAERQKEVTQAVQALEAGKPPPAPEKKDPNQALKQAQAKKAQETAKLAADVAALPKVPGLPTQKAADLAKAAKANAEAAAAIAAKDAPAAAANENAKAEANLNQVADALAQAAQKLAAQATAAAAAAPASTAPPPSGPLAQALPEAAMAAQAQHQAPAAMHAQAAAQALATAAQAALQAMTAPPGPLGPPGPPKLGPPRPPAPPKPGPPKPGTESFEGDRNAEGDQGMPPELTKLGISAKDWEKIRRSLKSNVGAAGGGGVPEDYRDLVRDYFENMAKEK